MKCDFKPFAFVYAGRLGVATGHMSMATGLRPCKMWVDPQWLNGYTTPNECGTGATASDLAGIPAPPGLESLWDRHGLDPAGQPWPQAEAKPTRNLVACNRCGVARLATTNRRCPISGCDCLESTAIN